MQYEKEYPCETKDKYGASGLRKRKRTTCGAEARNITSKVLSPNLK